MVSVPKVRNAYRQASPDQIDEPLFSATLKPYRSFNKQQFVIFMAVIAGTSFIAGLVFVVVGAWPVLGFFGLDVLAIWYAFHLNFRQAKCRETLSVSRTEITVRKVSANGSEQIFEFNPLFVRLEKSYRVEDRLTGLFLESKETRVPVGDFLPLDDLLRLSKVLGLALSAAKRGETRPLDLNAILS